RVHSAFRRQPKGSFTRPPTEGPTALARVDVDPGGDTQTDLNAESGRPAACTAGCGRRGLYRRAAPRALSASPNPATRSGTIDHHTHRPRFSPRINPASASAF